jgi:hypothetical protein
MAEIFNTPIRSTLDDMPQSTRLIRGGDLSGTLGGTTFNIDAGIGQIVNDATDPLNPLHTNITWPSKSNISITNINTSTYSWIGIDSNSQVVQFGGNITPAQLRQYVLVGILIHYDYLTLLAVFKETATPSVNASAALYDLSRFIAPINRGNQISPNGVNLKFNKAIGKIFQLGINWFTDRTNPNIQDTPATTAQPFVYVFRDGIGGWKNIASTDVNPTRTDNNTAVGAGTVPNNVVGGTNWSIQTVYIGYGGIVIIQYGTVEYTSSALARDGLSTEVIPVNPTFEGNLTQIANILVRGNCTDLSNTASCLLIPTNTIQLA